MLKKYINELCTILNIECPEVSYDSSDFETKTMLARCKSDGKIIQIKRMEKPTPDLMFAIAHELRHAWQSKYHKELFAEYKTADKMSIEEYNLQPAELDAHAFGVVIMANFFGLTPSFNNLSNETKNRIFEQAKKINI